MKQFFLISALICGFGNFIIKNKSIIQKKFITFAKLLVQMLCNAIKQHKIPVERVQQLLVMSLHFIAM